MLQFIAQVNYKISTVEAKKVINVNLLGAINCLSPVAKVMQKNKKGHIVFVSSPAYQGLPGGGFYGVSKSALTFLAETLNIEFHKSKSNIGGKPRFCKNTNDR